MYVVKCMDLCLVGSTCKEDELKKWSVVYSLAEVKCKKDTCKIFKATVHMQDIDRTGRDKDSGGDTHH